MNLTASYKVDISKPLQPTPLEQMLIQQDNNANILEILLFDGENPYAPGGSCAGVALRNDGVSVPLPGTVEGNALRVTLPEDAYSVDGALTVTIKSVSGVTRTTVFYGVGTVLIGQSETYINPSDAIPDITELMAEIGEMRAATADASEAAQAAEASSDDANSAAENADAQAQAAASAANAADAAAENANDSASAASSAAESASGAASAANQAAQSAQAQAQAASAAANTANTAAQAANSAAASAAAAAGYVAPVEATSTASRAYTAGDDYLIYNGKLYAVTASIAQGDTITPGTNCQEVTDGLGGEVSDLKSKLTTSVPQSITEALSLTWTTGHYINPDTGLPGDNADYEYSNKISVSEGDIIKLYRESDGLAIASMGRLAAYLNDTIQPSKGGSYVSLPYTVPSGVDEVIISLSSVSSYGDATGDKTYMGVVLIPKTDDTLTDPDLPANAKATGDAIGAVSDSVGDVSDALDDLEDIVTTTRTQTETITDSLSLTWTPGFVSLDGTTGSNTDYQYTNSIAVLPGDTITLYRGSDGVVIQPLRFVTCYKNGVANSALGSENASNPYTVPENVDAIIVSVGAAAFGTATGSLTRTTQVTTKIPTEKPDVDALLHTVTGDQKRNNIKYTFDLTAGTAFVGTHDLEDMSNFRICFDGKFTGTYSGSVRIGKGEAQSNGGAIGFDTTNIYTYRDGNTSTPDRTQAHGLTFKDYVTVIIDMAINQVTKITLATNGGIYTWECPFWRSRQGKLSVNSSAVSFSDCELTYTCAGLTKETWLYGDSYFSIDDAARWTYYLVRNPIAKQNYMLNGYPGRGSSAAIASLKIDLAMNRIPRRIIWCIGMNDKDASNAPNADWLSAVEELMQICTDKHIELILATIPNVPNSRYKNSEKNAYVEDSNYRYIDFANAISADGSSTWYDDMLHTDNVHPKTQGAIALFGCAVTEVPELLY